MLQLQLETTNVCNAACVFCPYPQMVRPKGRMTTALSDKLTLEALEIPPITSICFTGLGEPLLDRHLEHRIRFARLANPQWRLETFTNGTYLTHERAKSLSGTGLDTLYVSLNATNALRRKEIMAVDDFDKVVEQIRYAMSLGEYKIVVKGIVSKDLMENGDSQDFIEFWGGPTNQGGSAYLHLEGNWAGEMWPARLPQRTACSRALGQIMVLWDGRVSLCCFDAEGKEILGDLNHQTMKEIYNAGRALEIRTAHAEGRRTEIPICAGCTAI